MGPEIAIAIATVALIVVIGVVVLVASRRRGNTEATPTTPTPPAKIRPPDEPMTGLESALAQVTDRDGKPIRDRIDAEAGHVDELRVPDDTGPLLRRALDHVAPGERAAGDDAVGAAAESTDRTETDTDEPA